MNIHPTSVISSEAEIAPDAVIGPFCVIRGRVQIGEGTRLESHVVLGSEQGIVKVGRNNRFSPGCIVGGNPQDLKYKGEPTQLVIGDNNTIRECATLNLGTPGGGGVTRVANGCLIMAYVHIAHDCQIGDNVVIANSGQLAGHVVIEDNVKVGGVCAFNQFVRVGRHAFIGGGSNVSKDILPFTLANGNLAVVRAANKIGMERAGYSREDVENVHRAVRFVIMGSDTVEQALAKIDQECQRSPAIEHFVNFIKTSERGLAR